MELALARKSLAEELESLFIYSGLREAEGIGEIRVKIVSTDELFVDGSMNWLDQQGTTWSAPFQADLQLHDETLTHCALRFGRQDVNGEIERSSAAFTPSATEKWAFVTVNTVIRDRKSRLELSLQTLQEVAGLSKAVLHEGKKWKESEAGCNAWSELHGAVEGLCRGSNARLLRAADGPQSMEVMDGGNESLVIRGVMYCLLTGTAPFEITLGYSGGALTHRALCYGKNFPGDPKWMVDAENDIPPAFRSL